MGCLIRFMCRGCEMANRFVLSGELFDQLKPIFGLPDRVVSMSIDLPGCHELVSLNLNISLLESESKELVSVLKSYRIEKKSEA